MGSVGDVTCPKKQQQALYITVARSRNAVLAAHIFWSSRRAQSQRKPLPQAAMAALKMYTVGAALLDEMSSLPTVAPCFQFWWGAFYGRSIETTDVLSYRSSHGCDLLGSVRSRPRQSAQVLRPFRE